MEIKAQGLSDWFGLTAAAADWQKQPAHLTSAAKSTVTHLGDLPEAVKEAAAAGPMNEETFAAAAASTSKLEGRRMRTLAWQRVPLPPENPSGWTSERNSDDERLRNVGTRTLCQSLPPP